MVTTGMLKLFRMPRMLLPVTSALLSPSEPPFADWDTVWKQVSYT